MVLFDSAFVCNGKVTEKGKTSGPDSTDGSRTGWGSVMPPEIFEYR